MLLGIPLAVWLGALTFTSLLITLALGVAVQVYKKPLLKKHMLFAKITAVLAVVHVTFAILLWFFGVLI